MFEEVPGLRIYVCMGVFPEADGRSEEGVSYAHGIGSSGIDLLGFSSVHSGTN